MPPSFDPDTAVLADTFAPSSRRVESVLAYDEHAGRACVVWRNQVDGDLWLATINLGEVCLHDPETGVSCLVGETVADQIKARATLTINV